MAKKPRFPASMGYHIFLTVVLHAQSSTINIIVAVSEPEVNERGSCLIERKHFSLKCKGLWSNVQGVVVMHKWRN